MRALLLYTTHPQPRTLNRQLLDYHRNCWPFPALRHIASHECMSNTFCHFSSFCPVLLLLMCFSLLRRWPPLPPCFAITGTSINSISAEKDWMRTAKRRDTHSSNNNKNVETNINFFDFSYIRSAVTAASSLSLSCSLSFHHLPPPLSRSLNSSTATPEERKVFHFFKKKKTRSLARYMWRCMRVCSSWIGKKQI